MARRISNKISISCIDDGTTIHGSLMCDEPLSQGYDKKAGTCSPNWDAATGGIGPTIYLLLLNGDTATQPIGNDVDWYFNTTKLTFTNNVSTGTYAGYFQKTTKNNIPALKILKNLASSGNLNDDIIQVRGNVEVAGQPVGFSAGVTIQVGELNANGYWGVINFDGKSYMESDSDVVTMWSNLYAGSEVATGTNGWTCEWDFNGSEVTNTSSSTYPYKGQWTGTPQTNYNMLKIKGTDDGGVLDIATVTCRFYVPATSGSGRTLVFTATVTVDDISDEEYLYIFFTVDDGAGVTQNDGSPVSLHQGQVVHFSCYVAKENDSSESAIDTSLQHFYFQPKKADGSIPSSKPISDLGAAASTIGTGFYTMNMTNVTVGTATGKKATMAVTFDEVKTMGSNINGIILATD